jgi:WD40 repeat protein
VISCSFRTLIASIVAVLISLRTDGRVFAHKWVDSSGKYSVEAEFITLEAGKVKLRREDGRIILVSLEKLGKQDQERARRLAASDKDGNPADQERQAGRSNNRQRPKSLLPVPPVRIDLGGVSLPIINDLAVSANGHLLLVGKNDGEASLIDLRSGEILRNVYPLDRNARGHIPAVSFDRSAKVMCTAATMMSENGRHGKVTVWATQSGNKLCEVTGNHGAIYDAALAPDGTLVALAQEAYVPLAVDGFDIKSPPQFAVYDVATEELVWSITVPPIKNPTTAKCLSVHSRGLWR